MATSAARRKDFQRLKQVTAAAWLAAGQVLRKKAAEERVAADRVSALAADRKAVHDQIGASDADAAQVAAAARWLRWSQVEKARLNVDLARKRATLAREQVLAKRAFARDQALEALLEKLRSEGHGR